MRTTGHFFLIPLMIKLDKYFDNKKGKEVKEIQVKFIDATLDVPVKFHDVLSRKFTDLTKVTVFQAFQAISEFLKSQV